MIDFKPFSLKIREEYNDYIFKKNEYGCEHTFANMFMWGDLKYAKINGYFVFFACYNGKCIYPFPVGEGEIKPVLDEIINDASERKVPLRFTGVTPEDKAILEELYPDEFSFTVNRNSQDYVYLIDDLKTLAGKRYHAKRNHLNRFYKAFPHYVTEIITESNLSEAKKMIEGWYGEQEDDDFSHEKRAVKKAFDNYSLLGFEGMMLSCDGRILAITMASRLSEKIFDVHFEKADRNADGAYTAINYLFANYLSEKYPEIEYLNREEDMGLEGLRKAKLSYYPHHLVEKYSGEYLCAVRSEN